MQLSSTIRRVSATAVGIAAVMLPLAARATTAIDRVRGGASSTGGASGLNNNTPLPQLIGYLISSALGLLGIILIVIIIYAGYLWMTAQGNDEKVKQAKKMISNAAIGMVLIFAASAITTFVIGAISDSIGETGGSELEGSSVEDVVAP